MTKEDSSQTPQILTDLSTAVDAHMDAFDTDTTAMLTIGVATVPGATEEDDIIQTFIAISGEQNVLAEGLYNEIMDMIKDGDVSIFVTLRDVIRAIEEDLDIDPNEEIDDEPTAPTIH